MYEQRDTSVPRKHHADYRDRSNWGTTKTRKVHGVVYSFNLYSVCMLSCIMDNYTEVTVFIVVLYKIHNEYNEQ